MEPLPTAARVDAADEIRAVPQRYPGRWLSSAVIAVGVAMFVHTLLTNGRFEWDVVRSYLFAPTILNGLRLTILLTIVAMVIGVALGVVLAVMGRSHNPIVAGLSRFYVWLFRGTPLLVQLLFWFNLAALYPRISIGIPFGPEFASGSANTFITGITAAILGLGLNEGAYMAEIVRAGLISVDTGQVEAAESLGMSSLLTMRRIVLPQAIRVIIPPTGNEVISMLKATSLVSVIAVVDLLYSTQLIYSANYETIPLLIVASIWYLVTTTILNVIQHRARARRRTTIVNF